MSESKDLLFCYNKGCGKKFEASSNSEDSCQFHPGLPIFHDARKKWSCCSKGSTDFSVFLSMPGCATGRHNPEKPPDEAPKKKPTTPSLAEGEVIIKGPPPKPPTERPSSSEEMTQLTPTVSASLKTALEARLKQLKLVAESEDADTKLPDVIENGTPCKNPGCKGSFKGPETNSEVCYYHTGVPIFHEGYKFWSCCQRRTCDFDDFLSQVGCHEGKHKWISSQPEVAPSRWDWHQTGSFVTITLYAKCIVPESVEVKLNRVHCSIDCMYDAGLAPFNKSFEFQGVVDPSRSNVKVLGTKMEVNLRKAEPDSWSKLELPAKN